MHREKERERERLADEKFARTLTGQKAAFFSYFSWLSLIKGFLWQRNFFWKFYIDNKICIQVQNTNNTNLIKTER